MIPEVLIGNPGLKHIERKRKSLNLTRCFEHGSPIEALGDDVVVALGKHNVFIAGLLY